MRGSVATVCMAILRINALWSFGLSGRSAGMRRWLQGGVGDGVVEVDEVQPREVFGGAFPGSATVSELSTTTFIQRLRNHIRQKVASIVTSGLLCCCEAVGRPELKVSFSTAASLVLPHTNPSSIWEVRLLSARRRYDNKGEVSP